MKLSYHRWLQTAVRIARDAERGADLLQDALEIALRAGRAPLQQPEDAAWFHGVLKRHAAFIARGDIRRRERDARLLVDEAADAPAAEAVIPEGLPPAARRVLILALHGLDREEIRQVLGIGDAALRQRLLSLRAARERHPDLPDPQSLQQAWTELLRARNPRDAGARRAALSGGPARLSGFRFGFSDPDGNFFSFSSQTTVPRQQEDEAAATGVDGGCSSTDQEGNESC